MTTKSRVGPYGMCTDKGTEYVLRFVRANSAMEAKNAIMQVLIDDIGARPGMDLVWRLFPEVRETDNGTYTARARYCFESPE